MFPNKYLPVYESKIYKAFEFYNNIKGFVIYRDAIDSYKKIEYLTILYALGYIQDGGEEGYVKIFKSK